MTIHHQAHQDRIDAELAFEWDLLPDSVDDFKMIPANAIDVRLRCAGRKYQDISQLSGVKRLWIYGVNQDLLNKICALKSLEVLSLNRVTATDLAGLNTLPNLRSLMVDSASKMENLSWIPRHSAFRSLQIMNLKNVHDLTELSALTQLRALAVEGSMWTAMRVESLLPLAGLDSLEYLFLTNLRVNDKSLRPLHQLSRLKVLKCARFFPKAEFMLLNNACPELRCNWFDSAVWSANS